MHEPWSAMREWWSVMCERWLVMHERWCSPRFCDIYNYNIKVSKRLEKPETG